jgi:hypothetical protein
MVSWSKSYKVSNASVRCFNGKTLKTCPTTTITEIEDIEIINYPEDAKDQHGHQIPILPVSCTEVTHCTICRKHVGPYNKDASTAKCQNCKMRQKTTNIVPSYKCEIITKIDGETKLLHISHTVIKNFPATPVMKYKMSALQYRMLPSLHKMSCQILSIKNEDTETESGSPKSKYLLSSMCLSCCTGKYNMKQLFCCLFSNLCSYT